MTGPLNFPSEGVTAVENFEDPLSVGRRRKSPLALPSWPGSPGTETGQERTVDILARIAHNPAIRSSKSGFIEARSITKRSIVGHQ